MIDSAAWRSIRAASKRIVARDLDLSVEGREHLPDQGPVLLVARHFHHLYDGCAVMAEIPRQVQILVALDWVERPIALRGMQAACRAAGWPVVYRDANRLERARGLSVLREALRQSNEILRDGKVLLVFPEGFPTIDPHPTPKVSMEEILPFQTGFARIARQALDGGIPVQTIPLGFHYQQVGDRWRTTMRFGPALETRSKDTMGEIAERAHAAVVALSAP